MPADGFTVVASQLGPAETVRRLEEGIRSRGMTLFARIDHARGAAEAGMPLPSTDVLIFGSPRAGTPLMQAAQTAGIDLPLKVLVWQDGAGTTHLGYNDPAWVARRHQIPGADSSIAGMTKMLASLVSEAAGSQR